MPKNRKVFKLIMGYMYNMETVTIPKQEYKELKRKADMDEELLVSLVKGLEDIKAGRIKLWKKARD